MKNLSIAVAAIGLAVGMAGTANATVSVSVAPGAGTYAGPTPTYDFDTPTTTPVTIPAGTTPPGPGGIVVGGSQAGLYAQPLGSTGNFFSSGPSTTDNSVVLLNGLGDILNLSFIWGSIDTYNTLTFTDAAGNPLLGAQYSFTGTQIAGMIPAFATGNQTAADQNPLVTFLFSGGDEAIVRGFQLSSSGTNAFEIDNIAVNGVPEPGTWAMMLLGFGAIGLGMRRRKGAQALPQIA